MSKTILLIESDAGFASELSQGLEAAGFAVRTSPDGKDGFEAARDLAPDAIVLSAELPGTSGYLVCQKLKKDDALKAIPLVLTSAEATAETFEKHRQLKVRAQDYLLKPFSPEDLVEKLGALVGLPEAGRGGADEEVVSLEEEMGLEGLGAEPDALPALDLRSLPDEPSAPSGGEDDDLRLLDDAFEGLSAPARGSGRDGPPPGDEVDAAPASLPDEDERGGLRDPSANEDEDEADRALGALAADEPEPEPRPGRTTIRGASADLLRAAGIPVMGGGSGRADAPPRREGGDEESTGARALRARADVAPRRDAGDDESTGARALRARAEQAERGAQDAKARIESAQAQARKAEERAERAEAERDAARRKADEAAAAAERVDALERQVARLEEELAAARTDAQGARDAEKRAADLKRRVQDLEASAAKNEERVLKAYQKIKGDERLREKVRKALAIAIQLIDEGAPAETSAEKKISSALGRE